MTPPVMRASRVFRPEHAGCRRKKMAKAGRALAQRNLFDGHFFRASQFEFGAPRLFVLLDRAPGEAARGDSLLSWFSPACGTFAQD
jgi:hypothetical protein